MPRFQLEIDNIYSQLDSNNPDIIGKWFVETMQRLLPHGPSPATWVRLTIQPSFAMNERGEFISDWVNDSSLMGPIILSKQGMQQFNQQLKDAGVDTGLVNALHRNRHGREEPYPKDLHMPGDI